MKGGGREANKGRTLRRQGGGREGWVGVGKDGK